MLVNCGRLVGASILFALTASSFAGCSAADNQGQKTQGQNSGSGGQAGGVSGSGAKPGSGGAIGGGGLGSGNLPSGTGLAPIFDPVNKPDPNDKDGGCKSAVSQGEFLPLDIYIMFDQSQSMACQTAGGTRWAATKTALEGFVNNTGAKGIGVGIQYFGQGGIAPIFASCDVNDYSKADVPIAMLPGNAAPISQSLGRHNPSTNTPSLPALQAAITYAANWKKQPQNRTHTVIVLFVTDGQPNACNPDPNSTDFVQPVADAAAAGLALPEKIQTYVIGVISPDAPCNTDPNPPTQADLDRVAKAGGTETAFMIDVSGNASQKFLDAMNKIRAGAQAACEYALPTVEKGEALDPNLVNVKTRDITGVDGKIYRVTASTCDPTNGGWHYDDETTPTKILLCPASCTSVGQIGTTVNVEFGCVPSERPPQ